MKRIVILLLMTFALPLTLCAKKYPNTKENLLNNEKEKKTHQNASAIYQRIKAINQLKIDAFESFINDMPLEEKIVKL